MSNIPPRNQPTRNNQPRRYYGGGGWGFGVIAIIIIIIVIGWGWGGGWWGGNWGGWGHNRTAHLAAPNGATNQGNGASTTGGGGHNNPVGPAPGAQTR